MEALGLKEGDDIAIRVEDARAFALSRKPGREMIIEAIRRDPAWKGGDYAKDTPPHDWVRAAMPLFALMTSNAD